MVDKGNEGKPREILALESVEIANPNEDNDGIDGFVDVFDVDEVELQKRALAKKIYDILVTQANDPDSDNEFWDNTKKVYDIFKEELHPTQDYSWMWEQYIQPGLLSSLSAIVEDTSYLSENSKLVDRLPSVLKVTWKFFSLLLKGNGRNNEQRH